MENTVPLQVLMLSLYTVHDEIHQLLKEPILAQACSSANDEALYKK